MKAHPRTRDARTYRSSVNEAVPPGDPMCELVVAALYLDDEVVGEDVVGGEAWCEQRTQGHQQEGQARHQRHRATENPRRPPATLAAPHTPP